MLLDVCVMFGCLVFLYPHRIIEFVDVSLAESVLSGATQLSLSLYPLRNPLFRGATQFVFSLHPSQNRGHRF